MKRCFTLCVLATTFVCLHAAPRLARSELPGNGGSAIYWSDCTKPSDHGKINKITITPNPPVEGQKLSISVSATVDEEVTGGSVKVSVVYNSILLIYERTLDLCELLQNTKKSCPVPNGIFDITVDTKVPKGVPAGNYSGHVTATDQNDQKIFCINFNYKF